MSKDNMSNSEKTRQEKGLVTSEDSQLSTIDEMHKKPREAYTELTGNRGVSICDNKNSLRVNPENSTLLEDFVSPQKITHSVYHCTPECSQGIEDHGFFDLIAFSLEQYTIAKIFIEVVLEGICVCSFIGGQPKTKSLKGKEVIKI